ncbi:MAG: hypothetical protein ACP5SH_25365 [Syntrophobacteraceae bacterium]
MARPHNRAAKAPGLQDRCGCFRNRKRLRRLPYSSLYDMGYRDKQGVFHKIKRNGCIGCGTDLLYSNNHMAMLRRTHPKAWFTFMSSGMAAEIQKLQILSRKQQLSIYDNFDPENIMELKPCYFDSLKRVVMCDDTSSDSDLTEYDPEAINL